MTENKWDFLTKGDAYSYGFASLSLQKQQEYYDDVASGALVLETIDKHPSELTSKELDAYMFKNGLARFTTESLTMDEAKELIAKYKSYYLVGILPLEYLDNPEFMKYAIAHVRAITNRCFYHYASPRLRNEDYELASLAIRVQGSDAVYALEGSEIIKNVDFVISEISKERTYEEDGKIIRSRSTEEYIAEAFLRSNPDLKNNIEVVQAAIKANPRCYSMLPPEMQDNPEIIKLTIESMLERGETSYVIDYLKEHNRDPKIGKVIKTLSKVHDLKDGNKLQQGLAQSGMKHAAKQFKAATADKTK